MNDNLKEAFEQVYAEKELKNKTKDFIFQKTNGYQRKTLFNYRHFASAFACMVFLFFGGHWLYFTPTVEISIDINPSVELGVNRFNRIISLESYNEDGQELINSLDIKFMDYSEAVNQIVENKNIISLLSNDEIMTVAVIGTDTPQSQEILSNIRSCMNGRNNTYCYYAHSEEVEMAHEAGLSYGKYKAFLELQTLNPDVTIDEVQNMTMREIRNQINRLSNGADTEPKTETDAPKNGNGYHGNGNGSHENGNGNGSGSRNGQGKRNRRGMSNVE